MRSNHNVTNRLLSQLAGISESTISNIRHGHRPCPKHVWDRIKHVADFTPRVTEDGWARKQLLRRIPPDFKDVVSSEFHSIDWLADKYKKSPTCIQYWIKVLKLKRPENKHKSDAHYARMVGISRQAIAQMRLGRTPCPDRIWKILKNVVPWVPRAHQSKGGRPKGSRNKKKK